MILSNAALEKMNRTLYFIDIRGPIGSSDLSKFYVTYGPPTCDAASQVWYTIPLIEYLNCGRPETVELQVSSA